MTVQGSIVVFVILAVAAGCGNSPVTGPAADGSTDHASATDSGRIACGEAVCDPSEICLIPPCVCTGIGAEPNCAPYCVSPTPANPIDCQALDGGLSGTVTSAVGGSSRFCFHVCI